MVAEAQAGGIWVIDGAYKRRIAVEPRLYCTEQRAASLVTLWRAGLESDPMPKLIKLFGYARGFIFDDTIDLLGDLGPTAKPLLPHVLGAETEGNSLGTRRAAAIAIRKIDPREADRLELPGVLALP